MTAGGAPEPAEGEPTALAQTAAPVQLRVELLEDDRTPEGMLCLGTWRGDRLVARCVIPPELWEAIESRHLLQPPRVVALLAREAPPGLQCQLFAIIPLAELRGLTDDEPEPWADSVPGAGYEAAIEEPPPADALAALPLGNIVRYARDRVHPDDLAREAAHMLGRVMDGQTSELVDRALADLFGS